MCYDSTPQNVWQIWTVQPFSCPSLQLSLLCIKLEHFSTCHQYQYIVDCKYQYRNWLQLIANISTRIDCSWLQISVQELIAVDCKYQYKNWLQWLPRSFTSQYISPIPVQNWLLQVFPLTHCQFSIPIP